ncbi:hypothetical protein CASFOL_004995 [Castilleja foliolosa]|uniref:Aminoacyl-tRNA hydrolase n=1 Tax=Castilleja foliolosa TaxID=1961234 RepID=A0ABD3E489_9LAMI
MKVVRAYPPPRPPPLRHRGDLIDSWPLGSVVTQGCHASIVAIWEKKDDPDTLRYCCPSNLDSMHKTFWL